MRWRLLFVLLMLAALAVADALSPLRGLVDEQRALVANRACMAWLVGELSGAAGAAHRAAGRVARLVVDLEVRP